MNYLQNIDLIQDRYGFKAASYLCLGTNLPHDVNERLRVARSQAVAQRRLACKSVLAIVTNRMDSVLTWGRGNGDFNLLNAMASAVPLIALVLGLILIDNIQSDNRTRELAEVDAALLADDLPPAAFADSGFLQFLKVNAKL